MIIKTKIHSTSLILIKHGLKTTDVRPYESDWLNLSIGDSIIYNNKLKVKVVGIRYYETLQKLTDTEELEDIFPDHSAKEIRHFCYKHIHKVKKKGVFAIHLKCIHY